MGSLFHGDCLEVMQDLIDKGTEVDMILADLPYGTTQNKWDSLIDLEKLWPLYKKIIKRNGAIVLTAQQPFTTTLINSNPKWFRYEWIWHKTYHTGFLNSKRMPLKDHENILVFYRHLPTYNPQFTEGEPYRTEVGDDLKYSSNYRPQYAYTIDNPGVRYPRTVQVFEKAKGRLHPTQKPLQMFEYMIRTYTNEGELVLDNAAGSGTTAIACENTNRNWIVIEKEKKYVDIINKRLEEINE